jgi:hypothetical protein
MGLGQEPQLRALVGERPWLEVTDVRADLQGIPRAMTLHRTRT